MVIKVLKYLDSIQTKICTITTNFIDNISWCNHLLLDNTIKSIHNKGWRQCRLSISITAGCLFAILITKYVFLIPMTGLKGIYGFIFSNTEVWDSKPFNYSILTLIIMLWIAGYKLITEVKVDKECPVLYRGVKIFKQVIEIPLYLFYPFLWWIGMMAIVIMFTLNILKYCFLDSYIWIIIIGIAGLAIMIAYSNIG